jgi:hypothetical protein
LNLHDGDIYNGDICRTLLAAIKGYNPSIKILLYMDGGQPFQCLQGWYGPFTGDPAAGGPAGADVDPSWCSNNTFLWERWLAIGSAAGIVYRQEAPANTNFGWIGLQYFLTTDFAKSSVQTAMADIMLTWFNKQTEYDGIFCDEVGGRTTNSDITWMENGSQHIDYARDGFGSLGAWNTAFGNGVNTFYARLRAGLGSDKILIGNLGQAAYTNGGTRENWPNQDVANATIANYLTEQTLFRPPVYNWYTQWRDNAVPSSTALSAGEKQRAREALGVATLSDGYGMLTGGINDKSHGWINYWMDEFSVKNGVATAAFDTSGKHWLGARIIPATLTGNGMYYSTFDHGLVVCNRSGISANFTLPGGGAGYRHILGSGSGNDGSVVGATLFVTNATAVFLWKD